MVSVCELTEEDIKKYKLVFQACYDLFNDVSGLYYKIKINGNERILHRMENLFTIFELENENLNYEMFAVDENYKVIVVGFDNYEMHRLGEDNVFQRRDNGVTEVIKPIVRTNGVDFEGYNGLIMYTQYNKNNDMRVIITYQHNFYNGQGKLFPFHTKVPFQITIEKHVALRGKGFKIPFCQKTYIKRTFDYEEEPQYYTWATMKDFGVVATLGKDVVSLQGTSDITRYYKELFVTKDYRAISLFPFCCQYKIDDINGYLKSKGFSTSIPQILIDDYNDDLHELHIYQELADYIKEIEENKDYSKASPVVLKLMVDEGGDKVGKNYKM